MCHNLHTALVLFGLLPILIFLPACTKNTIETREEAESTLQEENLEAPKTQERLEKERQEREAEARELRTEKIKFMHEDIYFEKGSSHLTLDARELLRRKALWLLKNSDIKVIVEGHTDEAGSKEYNLALGEQRAGAAKSFLIRQGIESSRLIAVSFGNEQPSDTSGTTTAQSRNRRVHFVVEE
jgi:outer membrane protein OmpA-like peptidoglycan-associated protein